MSNLSHVHGVARRQYTHIVNERTTCSDLSSEMLFNCLEASWREARFKLHGEMETGGGRGGSRKGEKSPSESLLFLNVWNCSTFL